MSNENQFYKIGLCAYCSIITHTFLVLFRRGSENGQLYQAYTCHKHTDLMLSLAEQQGRAIPIVRGTIHALTIQQS